MKKGHTNISLAEYIENGGYDPNAARQAMSKPVDMYIAKDMPGLFPNAKGYEFENGIIGKSTKEVSEQPGVNGTFAFAFTYSPDGDILYFYAVRNGYCFYMNRFEGQMTTEVVEVSDDFCIPSYHDSSDKRACAAGW